MVAPDMATMLAFIATDAAIETATLNQITQQAVDASFNAITVDSDTSTSDTVLVLASGGAGNAAISTAESSDALAFAAALNKVMTDLAMLIVREAKVQASSSASMSAALRIMPQPADSALPLPIRRWSKQRSPVRMPTGDVSSWLSANQVNVRTGTGFRLPSAGSLSPPGAGGGL